MNNGDYPGLFAAADAAAARAQRGFFGWLALNLTSLTAAAGLSPYAEESGRFALLQMVTLVIGLGCTVYIEGIQPQRRWYRARALAESVKTLTWRYVMRAAPFEGEDGNARKKFFADIGKIVEENRDASTFAIADAGEQVTPAMERIRAMPLADRIEFYRGERIEDQHRWYVRKARQNADTARLWFMLLVFFNVLAIGLCVVRLSPEGREFWEHTFGKWPIDFFTIAAGSVLAWMQTKRFQELAATYTLTAYEIGVLRADLQTRDSTESRFAHFVADAVNAYSREHSLWRARRDTE
jgi:hypothetical protein